ncbi:MAG TPA: MarR family transcriptional regulator [Propionibacteriaceae bacterium]|nr:MarR family transcriptional regulator [Propionibacteriaceae bacterium]
MTDEVGSVPLGDEVDALVAAWRRERPDLVSTPMHVWSRIHRLAHYLDAARRRAYAAHNLETWEFDVLAALRRAGSPYRATPGQLLRETHVTSGTMTNRVDRLVVRGLVTRDQAPADRRVVLVQLTDKGKEAVDAAMGDLLAAERELLDGLDAAGVDRLARDLRTLLSRVG